MHRYILRNPRESVESVGIRVPFPVPWAAVLELIPESQQETNTDVATVGAMLGFAVMMTLDVALG